MAKSRIQTAKDWLVILVLSAGFIYLVLRSASELSEVLSRPLVPGHVEPSPSELATIFFGASSLALIIFSLLLAAAAIIEWQSLKHDLEKFKESAESTLEKTTLGAKANEERVGALDVRMESRINNLEKELRSSVDAVLERANQGAKANEERVNALDVRMESQIKELEAELRGRVDAVMGALIGTLHSVPTNDIQSEEDQAYLAEAVHHAQRGYERLKELPGNGKYMALNNVVYYSCLLRLQSKRDLLIAQARELRDIGRKYEHLPYAAPYLMTYARVVSVYSSDREEVQQALGIIRDVLGMRLTKISEREALHIEASLVEKLARLTQVR